MAKKSFTEKIKDDFKVPVIEEKEAADRKRAKPVPGARLIPLSDISLDSGQPRKKLDEEKLDDLTASIRSKGVIEPITVRQADEGYMIITGERRYKASKIAGLTEIPCIVKQVTDEETLTYQLIENLQREDLSPIDEAAALKKLLGTGLTQAQTAKMIGKSQPYISQALKILDLPQNILEEAQEMNTSKEHLLQLLKAENPEELWQQVKKGSTAEQIKKKVAKPKKGRPKTKPWVWKPEDKSFTVSIKFKKQDYDEEEIIKALVQLVDELRQTTLLPK